MILTTIVTRASSLSPLNCNNGNNIVTYAPKEGFRLGYFDVSCLVINRMIVRRSGGDLVYLPYVFRKPAYRKNTILLSTCIFGISFIILRNIAGNCIHFALCVMEAAGVENPADGPVRGIALVAAIFACGVHAISRRFGILLNNTLAVMKIMIMLLIIIAAIIVGAGGFPKTPNVIGANTSPKNSFKDASQEVNGYAQAFLAVIFTFSGFEQPNYVLGEISPPRRKFPIAMGTGVGIDEQIEENVAQRFFELTYSRVGPGVRIFNAFLAISSMGNIIVMTYTAAQVKQEIAKEGILPWPKFFARNTDMSIGRLIRWFQKKGRFASLHRVRWLSPEHHSERTPVGALFLHFVSCVILLFATYGIEPTTAYVLLTSLSAYVINAFIAAFLGLGILILRFCGPPRTVAEDDASTFKQESQLLTWAEMTGKRFRPFLSIFCALVYMCGGLYPVIANWVPPSGSLPSTVKP
ncbi:High-affinity methionine permease [Colletotrichum higginsianum]|uniref:High-affinity methionine permease n=1 Tax=Colletotrichum higginsianum TaxID=80884 RepID=A0A4T0VCS0_9PEZI|nr:High-affinity methionine permease [Colletotrichum higginsianum]